MSRNLFFWFSGLIAALLLLQSCIERKPFPEADNLLQTALEDSLFAGAVFLAGSSEKILHQSAFGYATLFETGQNGIKKVENPDRMTLNHVFDLASLTKVLATTYAIMILHDRGELHVDDPVYHYLPAFDTTEKREITLKHLLTHTSGLMQWYPTFYVADNAEERLNFVTSEPLAWPVGEQRKYSDLGFMVLADIVEVVTEQKLNTFLDENLYQPLGLKSTLFNPGENYPSIVSTSHGNPFEKKMVEDDNFGYLIDLDPEAWTGWRSHTLKGEVNDGNAYHTHGGVAGHAGLFSTAEEVYRLLTVLLKEGEIESQKFFDSETIALFLAKDQYNNGLGWAMDPEFLQAEMLPEGSFGHTGFTGTNIIISPEDDLILVLLTNRQQMGVNENGYYPNINPLRSSLSGLFFKE